MDNIPIDPGDMLTDEQLYDTRLFIMRLTNQADREHYDTGKRWRATCKCGDRWPCPQQEARLNGTGLLEAAIRELMYRRRFSRPLNGLERVRDAVEVSRGTYARPTQPIRFDCRPDDTEESAR